MVRSTMVAILLLALTPAAAWSAPSAPAERPLASLVPADAGAFREINLDRLLGKTSETADLRQVFADMQSLKVIRQLLAQEPEANRAFQEVTRTLTEFSEAVGPRIGVAAWPPDVAAFLQNAIFCPPANEPAEGASQPEMGPASGAFSELDTLLEAGLKILLVADVRDDAKLDDLLEFLLTKAEISSTSAPPYAEANMTLFAEGRIALARGRGWLALGLPADITHQAADLAAGAWQSASLWQDQAYQRVISRLPQDAILRDYVSAATLRHLAGALTMMLPSVELSPPDEGIGWAAGVRVDEQQGTKMITMYGTADINALPYLFDAPVGLEAAMLYPVFTRARESAQKAVCLSNMKNLAVAAQMYVVDNDDHFMPADSWVEALDPYLRNRDLLKCPADKSGAPCSYAMNRALSGKKLVDIEDPVSVVLFYETATPGDNPVGELDDVASPPRHLGGNNYAFADGHARWMAEVPRFEVE